jgi:signal peptidase I
MDSAPPTAGSPSEASAPRKPSVLAAHLGLGLLSLWCVAVLAFLLVGTGAVWLHAWGPVGLQFHLAEYDSMRPTINHGEIVLIAEHTIQAPRPRRGDIVLHHIVRIAQADPMISRVIGLPSDTIQLIAGRLHINGQQVPRERVKDYPDAEDDTDEGLLGSSNPIPRYREILPEGASHVVIEVFGDDGDEDKTAALQVPEGEVFVLGDNRDFSVDSRSKRMGTIPIRDIQGYPVMILWSKDRSRIGSVPR